MTDFYALADLKIDELNKLTIGRFDAVKRRLRKKRDGIAYSPMAVNEYIGSLYRQLDMDARREFLELAEEQYEAIATDLGVEELDEGFEDLFLENILSTPDPITKYVYDAEVFRKRDRAIESVNATTGVTKKQAELDKAMRLWSQGVQQYVDNVAYEAAIKAFKDAGVKYVKWIAQDDDRVCAECEKRNGKIYPINRLPIRPHYRCRCYIK